MSDTNNVEPLGWVKHWTPKDDWYYISPSERQKYLNDFETLVQTTIKKGAKLIGTYKCRGQSPWMRFEVWEFPELGLLIDFTKGLEDIGHYQYFDEDHTVGRRYDRQGSPDSWVI